MSDKSLKALVIGGSGEIGHAITEALEKARADVIVTSRKLDPNNPKVKRLHLEHPERFQMRQPVDVAYFCAGMTCPADCQDQPRAVLGNQCEKSDSLDARTLYPGYIPGLFFVAPDFRRFGSSNQRGRSKKPHSRFAEQKVAVEEHLSKLDSGFGIIRLSDVIGSNTPFLKKWTQALKAGETVQAIEDLSIAPVGLDDVVKAAIQIGIERKTGIFQLSGDKDVPYDRVAVELAEQLGVPSSLVQSIQADDAHWKIVARPEHTTLDCSRARRELGFKPQAWSEILSQFIEANRLRSEQPYSSIADEV